MSRKNDPEFTRALLEHFSLNEETGVLKFNGLYAQTCLNIGSRKGIVVVPYSHVVWLLKHGQWPRDGFVLDHINDDSSDNRPANLQEITQDENQKKRRGRKVSRYYGSGKYGHGINVTLDKRSGRYYIRRHLSRGHGSGNLKTPRWGLGGFNSLVEAERMVNIYIAEIEKFGPTFVPSVRRRRLI